MSRQAVDSSLGFGTVQLYICTESIQNFKCKKRST